MKINIKKIKLQNKWKKKKELKLLKKLSKYSAKEIEQEYFNHLKK